MSVLKPKKIKSTQDLRQLEAFKYDSYLWALMYFTRHYDKLFSAESLISGLPLRNDKLTPFLFVRAARRAALSAKVVDRSVKDISPHVLPVVALTKGNKAVIITHKDEDGNITVLNPETGMEKRVARIEEFEENYQGAIILVKEAAWYERRPDTFVSGEGWFWDTIKQFWRMYVQVAFAAIVINLIALAAPLFIMNVYDRVVPNSAYETLWVLTIGVTLAFVFDFILKVLRGYFIDVAGRGADILLAGRLFQQVLNIRLGRHGTSAGSFANQLREFEGLRDFFTSATLVTFIDLPFVLLFVAIIAMIGGPVGLIPLLAVPLVILVSLAMQKPLDKIVEQAAKELDAKHGHLVESVSAIETIKALNAQSRTQARWEQYVGSVAKVGLRSRFLASLAVNFSGFATQLTSVLVVFYGVYLIDAGEMSIGALIACTILTGRAMAPLGQSVALYTRLQQSKQSLRVLNGIMAMEVERPDGKNFVYSDKLQGEIMFQNVSFTYPNAPLESLKEVDLRIRPGEKVGIIGRTGSGKSSLLRLILNLYNPTSGSLLLDGLEIRQMDPVEFRRDISYVPQSLVLFNGSLRENLLVANSRATSEEVVKASNMSGVSEFVRRHPMGFDMPVGERGSGLSGGQRQTVAIARALLKDAPVMLLDEPTSELDNRSEAVVLDSLKEHTKDKTLVVVTHKYSMLDLVDRVIVMDYGRIVADGPKDKILSQLQGKKIQGAG